MAVKSFPKKPTKKRAEKPAKVSKPKKEPKPKKAPTPKKAKTEAKAKSPVAEPKKRGRPRKPRALPLPGMEDSGIQELDDIAEAYAEIRDSRIALNKEEADLKSEARKLMHKWGKTIYRHDGHTVLLIAGDEDVKVKIDKRKEEEVEPDMPESAAQAVEDAPGTTNDAGEGESPSADDESPF